MTTVYPQIASRHETAARRRQEDGWSDEVLRRTQTSEHGTCHPELLELWVNSQQVIGHLGTNVLYTR